MGLGNAWAIQNGLTGPLLCPNYASRSRVLTHRCWRYGFKTPASVRIGTVRIRRNLVISKPMRSRVPELIFFLGNTTDRHSTEHCVVTVVATASMGLFEKNISDRQEALVEVRMSQSH